MNIRLLFLCIVLFITSCAYQTTTTGHQSAEIAKKERAGLATRWGETRYDPISTTTFIRAAPDKPLAVVSLYYNDEQGIHAMTANKPYAQIVYKPISVQGLVSFGLQNQYGDWLPHLTTYPPNQNHYVIGETGERYLIVVKNDTGFRLEVVLSVDGLDVIDGKTDSLKKSGYVLAPYAKLEIEGFRRSLRSVAAFRFGSVAASYANQKYGDTRQVGVIGLAVFHESGHYPPTDEINLRHSAIPFSEQRFATPP